MWTTSAVAFLSRFAASILASRKAKSNGASVWPDDSWTRPVRHRMPITPSVDSVTVGDCHLATLTDAAASAGFQITLKSRHGPFGRRPLMGSSPEKATGSKRFALSAGRFGRSNSIPGPSMTVRMRHNPGKVENGPSEATSAMLSRQANSPSSSCRAISRVTPPPFFQGTGARSAYRRIFIFSLRLGAKADVQVLVI